ncbi:insulinase family protein [Oculatella sp. FACHB-28]|uniref:M16 family metallopeptidase n=1 Tax=Oculatella sp. FACHB-28 TaxID=2692845 RepID=UPI001684DAD4|nr:pitrilysin family protein [Oculatella sp. FACHB-28]MBD2055506.1 insulinase family protein [Oculatella sp. FACHB-28]
MATNSVPPHFPAHLSRLDNGLTVIHQNIPTTSVVAVDVWVRAGAIAEPEPWTGMAHFLEHMVFKGTDRLLPGQFDQVIEDRGGMTNAATSHDYAHYFINTTAPHLEETLPCLADLLLNAAIPEDEFVRERDVVLEEIRQANDDPDWLAFQALIESVYQSHPYGRPVLGDEAGLMQRSPQEMRCFHRAHYQPENMTVVVVGNVTQSQTLDLVHQAFSQFPSRPECPMAIADAEPPITEIRRQELYLPRLEQARLMMAWIGPGVDQLRDAYGLDLLSVLLAGSRSSRLVRELREERQLVQAIGSEFSLQRDSSLFTISAWLTPEDVDRVEALIGDRLSELTTTPISEAELIRYKRLLCNDYAFSTETAIQLAGLYGYYNTIAQAEIAVNYPNQIQTLQAEELQQLASQYLSPYHYAATILKPL